MFITGIFYNEKGNQFRKVMYCTNTELERIAAIRYEETLLKDFFIKHPNAKGSYI